MEATSRTVPWEPRSPIVSSRTVRQWCVFNLQNFKAAPPPQPWPGSFGSWWLRPEDFTPQQTLPPPAVAPRRTISKYWSFLWSSLPGMLISLQTLRGWQPYITQNWLFMAIYGRLPGQTYINPRWEIRQVNSPGIYCFCFGLLTKVYRWTRRKWSILKIPNPPKFQRYCRVGPSVADKKEILHDKIINHLLASIGDNVWASIQKLSSGISEVFATVILIGNVKRIRDQNKVRFENFSMIRVKTIFGSGASTVKSIH